MLLERPFNEVLKSGSPGLPFCLCWANENWTRAWDGLERQLLIKQDYNDKDSKDHINWFIDVFKDERYIKIDGRPLLLIYRLDHLPDTKGLIGEWRKAVRNAGFSDIYLVAVKNGFVQLSDEAILENGFDGIVDFQPNRIDFPNPTGLKAWLYRFAKRVLPDSVYQRVKVSVSANNIVDYRSMVKGLLKKEWPKIYRKFPTIFPSWDNSARRKSATIIQNDDPELFGEWLHHSIECVEVYPESERLVFVNAWNEWAEGCHLEPDQKYGKSFLEQTRKVVELYK
ncbi:MAG TPA: glycoside hydrolase family 99-like domain-containing protein, partial [Cellvibrionaceae bacterium]|nr:glycoside hydrolase family 99-like domain-containing protein [Cellvibrionaceae bacterium]